MIGDIYEVYYKDNEGIYFHSIGEVVKNEGAYYTMHTLLSIVMNERYLDIWTLRKDIITHDNVKYLGTKEQNPEYYL